MNNKPWQTSVITDWKRTVYFVFINIYQFDLTIKALMYVLQRSACDDVHAGGVPDELKI